MLTRDRIRQDVAAILDADPASLRDDDDLLDAGMDSIRLMTLAERWREAGVDLDFVELAETPTLAAWQSLADAR